MAAPSSCTDLRPVQIPRQDKVLIKLLFLAKLAVQVLEGQLGIAGPSARLLAFARVRHLIDVLPEKLAN
jgi:hypothetical protein